MNKKKKKRPKYMFFIDFINKGFDYIINKIGNKIFNYKQTFNEIYVSDKSTYGTGLTSFQCQNSSFVDDNYGHNAIMFYVNCSVKDQIIESHKL